MFTGIVQGTLQIRRILSAPGLMSLFIDFPDASRGGLLTGASVSINGICLTVSGFEESLVRFDCMQETLDRTTAGALKEGEYVNFERAAKVGDEIGGHLVSGHVDCVATLVRIARPENNYVLTFQVPETHAKYVFEKGFIALHGASLTVARTERKKAEFDVYLIPETLRQTNLGSLRVGDKVNVEIDRQTQVVVETVERVLAARS